MTGLTLCQICGGNPTPDVLCRDCREAIVVGYSLTGEKNSNAYVWTGRRRYARPARAFFRRIKEKEDKEAAARADRIIGEALLS